MDNELKFSYPAYYKYSSYLLSLMVTGMFVLVFFRFTEALVLAILEHGFHIQFFLFPISFIILTFTVSVTVILYWQEFTVTNNGIEFQVFIFWRILIPWSEIISIKKSHMPWGKYHAVITERLTPLHRIMGILYGFTLHPAFVFNNSLSNYDKAVEEIQQRLNQR